jgi:ABC-type branched-subunit amino acid transport system substrate-binding protein
MMSNDKVHIFDSGCVSAGNAAAAGSVVRAQIPMMLCSILPTRPEEQKWAFSVLPPPRFEVESRYQYLKDKTDIRKVGILHDPTPYAILTKDLGTKLAKDFGLEVVAVETYNQNDADLSVQIGKINGAGAGAIIKMGQGGSTVTAARTSGSSASTRSSSRVSDDGETFLQAGEILGERFMFVAPGVQVPEVDPGRTRPAGRRGLPQALAQKHGNRETRLRALGFDDADRQHVETAKSTEGPALRDAFEKISGFQGAFAIFNFSPGQHVGITENPFTIGAVRDRKLVAQ